MMTYRDLIKYITEQFTNYCIPKIKDEDTKDLIKEMPDDISALRDKSAELGVLYKFVQWISEFEVDDSELPPTNWQVIVDDYQNQSDINYKDLVYINKSACVTNSESIHNLIKETNESKGLYDFFWKEAQICCQMNDNTNLCLFWNYCESLVQNKYIVLTEIDSTKSWRVYSYAVLCYSNSNRTEMPQCLEQDPKAYTSCPIEFNEKIPYEQYYDIYDVIGESHYANDVLLRYLRMFQVMEHMVYRVEFAKIVNDTEHSGLVRNILSKVNSIQNTEKDVFVKNVAILFPRVNWTLDDDAKDNNDAVGKIYGDKMKNDDWSIKQIAKVMYAIRNSIVHNKESELHFSYGNYKKYEEILPLIRKMITKFEPLIIAQIQDNNKNNPIKYRIDKLPLY